MRQNSETLQPTLPQAMKTDRKKYYFFRDKDHRDNLVDGTDYHAAGIVMECYDPSPSGKDMTVKYIDPFNVLREIAWRSYKDVVLFEVDSVIWSIANARYEMFDK